MMRANDHGDFSKGVFVTATDTGVGKTVAAAAIIRSLKLYGVNVGAMKPFETGLVMVNGEMVPADGTFLRKAAEMDDTIEFVTPQRFESPLSPWVAASRENKKIDLEAVLESYERLSRKYDYMVVEGAGGVMVPIGWNLGKASGMYYMLDLIKDLRLDAVVIARPLLGSINHTLLTVFRLLDEGVRVAGVIINHSCPCQGSLAEETNVSALKEICPAPLIAELPYIGEITLRKIDFDLAGLITPSIFLKR